MYKYKKNKTLKKKKYRRKNTKKAIFRLYKNKFVKYL